MRVSQPTAVRVSVPSKEEAHDALVSAMISGDPKDLAIYADKVTRSQDHTGSFGDRATSVLNHAAMAAAYRRGELDEPLEERLHASLQASWVHLTGDLADDVTAPLPVKVLKSVDPLTAAFAGATDEKGLIYALEHYNAGTTPAAPTTAAERLVFSAAQAANKVLSATKLDPGDASTTANLDKYASAVGPVAVGFGASYVIASWFESFYHDHLGHMDGEALKKAKKGNFIQRSFAESFETHNYHHGIAHQHYDVHNESDEKIAQRRAQLIKRGREDIADEDFGVTISDASFVKFLAGMLPVYGPGIGAAVVLGAPVAAIAAAIIPALMVPGASKWMHRYMHMSDEDAKERMPKILHPLIETSAWEKMKLRHFAHHERPKGGINFNILPGNIGDMMRSSFDEATPEETAEAERIGLIKKKP